MHGMQQDVKEPTLDCDCYNRKETACIQVVFIAHIC